MQEHDAAHARPVDRAEGLDRVDTSGHFCHNLSYNCCGFHREGCAFPSRGNVACAAGGQEGDNLRFSPSCQSSPFPRSSDGARGAQRPYFIPGPLRKKYEGPKRREFRADGIASYPRIGRCILSGAGAAAQKHPEKSLRETGQPAHSYSRAPPPPSPGAKGNRRDVIASQIFPQHVEKIWMRSRAAGHIPWQG